MFNFKAFTLAALTAATTLAPAAQAAYTVDGIKYHDAGDFKGQYAKVMDTLDELGVPVVDGRGDARFCEEPDEDGKITLGWYTGQHNFVVICYGDDALRAETLAHEAVHVFQDCRAGFDNATVGDPDDYLLNKIADNLPEHKANLIVNLYDEEDWKIEAEAFLLEDHPEIVNDGLGKYCF